MKEHTIAKEWANAGKTIARAHLGGDRFKKETRLKLKLNPEIYRS